MFTNVGQAPVTLHSAEGKSLPLALQSMRWVRHLTNCFGSIAVVWLFPPNVVNQPEAVVRTCAVAYC